MSTQYFCIVVTAPADRNSSIEAIINGNRDFIETNFNSWKLREGQSRIKVANNIMAIISEDTFKRSTLSYQSQGSLNQMLMRDNLDAAHSSGRVKIYLAVESQDITTRFLNREVVIKEHSITQYTCLSRYLERQDINKEASIKLQDRAPKEPICDYDSDDVCSLM